MIFRIVGALVGFAMLCPAQNLPVRKVVLYKNGLGYFEHDGKVTGNQAVEIVLPSRQLDDVLKSLTVIDRGNDRGKGRIAGVTYDSVESLDRRLAELPVKVDPSQGLVDFLNKIPGAEVELATSTAPGALPIAGRLMSAEIRQKKAGEYVIGVSIQVNILTAKGEVRSVELPSASSLRIVKSDLAGELRDYLTLLDSAHQRDSRRLKIQTAGTGERPLLVSYTAEAPIWKTTYRLVLDDKHKPLLQGWAIVDNTTANEWEGVELSLVAGQPISFIQNLSQPLYGRRPVVPLAQGSEVTPQTHQATLELPAGTAGISGVVSDSSGATVSRATVSILNSQGQLQRTLYSGDGGRFSTQLEPGNYQVRVQAPGFQTSTFPVIINPDRATALNPALHVGTSTETVTVHAESLPMINTAAATTMSRRSSVLKAPPPPASMGDMIRESETETAQAQPVGDQFEYKLRQPVTIHRNQSALLPIVNTEVDGEKVSLYSESTADHRPRFAIWLKNSSGLTLDAGSFSVIDSDAFAGEGLSATIHPRERRLLSYALDSGLEISSVKDNDPERVEKVAIAHGVMIQTRQLREKKTYVIRNNDDKQRVMIVEHPSRTGWTLVDTSQPVESSAGFHRFRVETRPKTTTEFTVHEVNQQKTSYEISNVDSNEIALWVREKSITLEMQRALEEVIRRKAAIAAIEEKGENLEAEQKQIGDDQNRMRENLGKLNANNKDEASLRQRYVKQMEQQEDRLAEIRKEGEKLGHDRDAAQKSLDDYVMSIAIGT